MIAHRVATPVLEREGRGAVAGVVDTAAYVDLDGFVVAITARGVPLMPNGIALATRPAWPVTGTPARLRKGRLEAGSWRVTWSAEDAWEPRLPPLAPGEKLRARGAAILAALGTDMPGGVRDPDALIGRGPGLTPEGDDLLAGAAAVMAALGAPLALPPDLRTRTTALSATLLELAAQGRVMEPMHALLDLADDGWPAALDRLARIGHSTGRAYAAGAAAACEIGSGT